MEWYKAQYIQNKVLNGVSLSEEEQEFLAWFNQANDKLFSEWNDSIY
nr:MAG TPA: hypothetical protein [Bacteriophage sp.]